MKTTDITENMVRLMSKTDRKRLGFKTREEAILAEIIKEERDLHKQIGNLLRLRGIEFFSSRMDKRTTRPVGEPDFLFAVWTRYGDKTRPGDDPVPFPIACAWELKMPGRPLDPEQVKKFEAMQKAPNAWCCRRIESVDEALAELKRLGL